MGNLNKSIDDLHQRIDILTQQIELIQKHLDEFSDKFNHTLVFADPIGIDLRLPALETKADMAFTTPESLFGEKE